MSLAGKILYHGWHRPVGALRDVIAAGGPIEMRRTERGRREMACAARELPALPAAAGAQLELHLLTGLRFWDQTAFCLWTFARHAGRPLAPVIYDDGTLTADLREPLQRLFPAARFVARAEIEQRLEKFLPAANFPALRERWLNYPNLRKLTDPHLGATGWKLVLDSDLLFFRRPEFLLAWLGAPDRPLHAVDCETSYGYSRPLMTSLAGQPVAELVNVGLTGLDGGSLDWERLEYWTRILIERERTSYYLEQALVAMLVAGRDCAVAPPRDYVTMPRLPEAVACRAVMHHYVAGSKRWYFQQNWRHALQ
ncbi:MAG TPA: glycosyl transferase [Candidatus Limnocylindria bacterium]|jgi:hypothetical protein|nr:glycosyl transferase [Candidatus Limnocylindria bacterium]HTL66472.1 glycosyl transferase family 2 [Lacunisphaera sp.]